MKRAFVLCALVGVAVYATTAWSASGPTPIEQRLSKDVATLKKQVSTLQKQVKTINNNTAAAVSVLAILGICSTEITADNFQSTWQIIDQLSAAQTEAPGKTYFGPQAPVTATVGGQDWCSQANVTRSPSTTGLAPTVAQYEALLAPFHTFSDSLRALALRLSVPRWHLK